MGIQLYLPEEIVIWEDGTTRVDLVAVPSLGQILWIAGEKQKTDSNVRECDSNILYYML